MNMSDVEDSLPNGFHDAILISMCVDYSPKVLRLVLDVCIDDFETDEIDRHRLGELTVSGLQYLAVEAPRDHANGSELLIDMGKIGEPNAPAHVVPPEHLAKGSFCYWIFVSNWNSFIYFAALDASWTWQQAT